MSYNNYFMSVTFRNANKSYKGKNRNGKKPVVQYREQKGNWLYSHFQKIYNPKIPTSPRLRPSYKVIPGANGPAFGYDLPERRR